MDSCTDNNFANTNVSAPLLKTANIELEISTSEAYGNILNFASEVEDYWEQCPNLYSIRNIETVPREYLTPFLEEFGIELDATPNDCLLYIFNFNGGGWAVASADRRLNETVFALTESGSLQPENLMFQPSRSIDGLTYNDNGDLEPVSFNAVFNESFPYSATELIMYSVATHFSQDFFNHYYYAEWEVDSTNIQLLTNPLPKYCQETPFNDSCPTRNGSATRAGCEPIALLMTLVHNSGNIFTLGDKSTGRDSLHSYYLVYNNPKVKSDVAYYAHHLGRKSFTMYGVESSSTAFRLLRNVMAELDGYQNVRIQSFDESLTERMISRNNPVILEGHGSEGHAFDVEGVKYEHRQLITWNNNQSISGSSGTRRIWLQCNFGWDDRKADGWYLKSLENVTQDNGSTHYYGERLRMIKYDYIQH